jgi:signal transduction histidine kinase
MTEEVHSPRILVVDDDDGLQLLFRTTLENARYEVTCVGTSEAMMDAARRQAFDLMLLDLKLRDGEGGALLDRLNDEGIAIPFVIVTGQGDEQMAVKMMRRGALDYISKTSAVVELLPSVVGRALATVQLEFALHTERIERERLERKLVECSESEQRRIGQDLHDGLGQQLTAIEILCAGLKSELHEGCPRRMQLERIGELLRGSISQVRSLARGLVPVGESPDALWASLVELVDTTNELGTVRCSLEPRDAILFDDKAAAIQLYRIVQEAVNNAVKHSGAHEIIVKMIPSGPDLVIEIRDNGRGVQPERGTGLGLQLMHHRAGSIGADLSIERLPSGGTSVSCRYARRFRNP